MGYLLHQLLTDAAGRHPERPAMVHGERRITYGELDRATARLATRLIDLGVRQGDLVGIYLRRGIESVLAALAVLKAGGIYVPLDPLSPADRLRRIVDACSLGLVITAPDGQRALLRAFETGSPLRGVVLLAGPQSEAEPKEQAEDDPSTLGPASRFDWTAAEDGSGIELPNHDVIDTDPAYVLFTSGSTGLPKGVVISHLNALAFIDVAQAFFAVSPDDRLSNICALHADMSVFDIYVALKAGACVVVIPESDAMFPSKLAETISRGRVTIWNSVPSALALLSTLSTLVTFDMSSLRLVLFAGEVFPLNALRRLQAAIPGARYCNMYGQTEANTSTYHWVDPLPDDFREAVPIGRSLPNFDVFALDADGQVVVEPGGEGELYVRSSTVAIGYWNDPGRTAAAFVPDPRSTASPGRVYRTGDRVRLDRNDEFAFVGRHDLMVKSRGYRVEIGEVEEVLRNHPAIRNAAVLPVPDERIGNRLSAFIELGVPGSLTKSEVVAYCVAELPHYMVPDEVTFREALPLTSLGKVDRMRLVQP